MKVFMGELRGGCQAEAAVPLLGGIRGPPNPSEQGDSGPAGMNGHKAHPRSRSGVCVEEYRFAVVLRERVLVDGKPLSGTARIVRWVILDGKQTPAAKREVGTRETLQVEAYEANEQLQSLFISDTFPEDFETDLFYSPTL